MKHMYKFQYLRRDKITGKVKKVAEMYLNLYESCIEQERIQFKGLNHDLYEGHAIITPL